MIDVRREDRDIAGHPAVLNIYDVQCIDAAISIADRRRELAQHPGVVLVFGPNCQTVRHARLLSCHFTGPQAIDTGSPDTLLQTGQSTRSMQILHSRISRGHGNFEHALATPANAPHHYPATARHFCRLNTVCRSISRGVECIQQIRYCQSHSRLQNVVIRKTPTPRASLDSLADRINNPHDPIRTARAQRPFFNGHRDAQGGHDRRSVHSLVQIRDRFHVQARPVLHNRP